MSELGFDASRSRDADGDGKQEKSGVGRAFLFIEATRRRRIINNTIRSAGHRPR